MSDKLQTANRALVKEQRPDLKIEDEVALVNRMLCPKTGRFAAKDCIENQCSVCKDVRATLEEHYSPLLESDPVVTWLSWSRVRKEKKVSREPLTRQGPFKDLLEELLTDLLTPAQNTTLAKHLFVAHWQYHQFKTLKDNLSPQQILMVMDFAENRKSRAQDEVKSAFYDKEQITLHPIIVYYRRSEDSPVVRHALDFVSNDLTHDHHAVHAFTLKALKYLQEIRVLRGSREVVIFSDGCAAQYKGKGTFADLSQYPFKIQRCYYGSEHGKGEADAETGTISKSLDTAVLCRQTVIRNSVDLFSWAEQNLSKDDDQG